MSSFPSVDQMRERIPVLSFENVSLKFTGPNGEALPILHEVNLRVQAGETVSICGPSGSGKTSLFALAAGVERASAGSVKVSGRALEGMDEDALAAFRGAHIGVVFQQFHLIPSLTALENVALAPELAGRRDAQEAAKKALTEMGLGARLGHYPTQLSGGEQQRVAVARAFVMRPKLLLADEPTGNLDSANGKKAADLLFNLQAETGCALALITHDPALARRASRRFLMEDGRLFETADGAPHEAVKIRAGDDACSEI